MSLTSTGSELDAFVTIKSKQLSILYKNQLPSLLFSIMAAILVAVFSFVSHSGLKSFVWLIVLIIVSAASLQVVQISKAVQARLFNTLDNKGKALLLNKHHRRYNFATFLIGCMWGGAPFVMTGEGGLFEQLVFIYALAGLSASALVVYPSSTLSFLCFSIPVISLSVLKLAMVSGSSTPFMIVTSLVYLGVLTLTSVRLQSYIAKGIELKHTNEKLLDTERNQRQELLKSAERLREHQLSLEVAKVWTWETDANLLLTRVSAAFQSTTGVRVTDILNLSVKDAIKLLQGDEFNPAELVEKMFQAHVINDCELKLVRPDGAEITLSINAVPHYNKEGKFIGYRGVGRDISPIKNSIRKLQSYANRDSLTNLYNRRAFHEKVEALTCNRKTVFEPFYIAYIDLDRLKLVNDTVGHICGDKLLQELSKEMSKQVDSSTELARIGGDEFALILHDPSIEHAVRTVENIIQAVRNYRFTQNESSFSIGVNVGVVPVMSSATTVTELVRYADHACFVARESGDYGYHVASAFSDAYRDHEKGTQSVQKMFDALEKDRLAINYQPIASVVDGKVHFFEALLNWKDPADAASSAGAHISIVEKYGVMAHFDRWVIRDVFRDFSEFQKQYPEASVFVNLSGSNLDDENLFSYIREQLAKYSVPREKICFEITETAAIRNTQEAIQLIKGLKSSGCRFALDDFGTGLASLSYLKDFPVDFVKLDGRFIHNLKNDPIDQAILKAVTELGESLGFSIIAESVEDAELIPYLQQAGVSFVQGYSIGYPKTLS